MTELPSKENAFFEWYNEVLEQAFVIDKRYPVKGLNVWTPFGFQALAAMDRILRDAVAPLGYEEVNFPALIPETEFQKEKDHIKGFDRQVYWVTHGGATPLDVRLVLRPTSETAMYPIFALWVRSHTDLPLRVFQIVNTFRYETKTTRPMFRVREIHFFEGHTVQRDEQSAAQQVEKDLGSFRVIAEALGLSYLVHRRPEWDKFPGAHYSLALDIPLGEGRTLQIGTVHHYRDNFSRPYGISYEDAGGERRFAHQTTYGISERLLGAVIGIHGDSKGLVWPPSVAPVQVVIVPVPGKGPAGNLTPYAEEIEGRLRKAGLRVRTDDGPDRPGAKYYLWELKGAPLRLEVGPRESSGRTVTLVDRLGHRSQASADTLEAAVTGALERFRVELSSRARAAFLGQIEFVATASGLATAKNVRLFGWCGAEKCGHAVDEAVGGSLLGTVEGPPPPVPGLPTDPPSCVICGATPSRWATASRPL